MSIVNILGIIVITLIYAVFSLFFELVYRFKTKQPAKYKTINKFKKLEPKK